MSKEFKVLEKRRVSHEKARLWNPNVRIVTEKLADGKFKATVPGQEDKWNAEGRDEMDAVYNLKQKVHADFKAGKLQDLKGNFI